MPVAGLLCLSCSTAPLDPFSSPRVGFRPTRLTPHSAPSGVDRDSLGEGLVRPPTRLQPQPFGTGAVNGVRAPLNQSCGAACGAPVTSSTGELAIPATTRLGAVAEKTIRAVEAAQGLLTLERALTGAELDHFEGILKECVAQAHADVNEAYQKQNGGFPFKSGGGKGHPGSRTRATQARSGL